MRPRSPRFWPVAGCLIALAACGRDPAARGASAGAAVAGPAPIGSAQGARGSADELPARLRALEEQLWAEREAREAERSAALAERERLECELADLRGELTEREEEFLRTLQAVGTLAPQALPAGWVAAPASDEPDAAPDEAAEPPERVEARSRAAERLRSLRNLLAIEDVYGLDLLEIGLASEGGTGPVVFRLLDGHGRPAGSLFAQRLRLEGSRAARTVTIVLEHGYELRAGEKTPFEGASDADGQDGVRRIQLAHVDPARWIEALPELFGPKAAAETEDDGRFDLRLARETLNRLLAEDAAHGWWRVDDFAGVVDGAFRKVALRRLDRDGKLERLLFADRMRVQAQGESVCLVLEDGAQVRGDEKAPFLDGTYRIFLPRASAHAWRAAGVPGLAQPPPSQDETARER